MKIIKKSIFRRTILVITLTTCMGLFLLNLSSSVFALVTDPPPGVPADNYYFKKGLLDVTLYGADPTGQEDSTQAIQNAVNAARDYQLAAFFPNQENGERGIYLVSDTIKCFMRDQIDFDDAFMKPNVLLGSTKGAGRPSIKLQKNVSKFSDPAHPVPLIRFWAMPGHWIPVYAWSEDPTEGEDDVSFHQVFKGIDIDLNGNPGAYGIRHAGAEGSAIEDTRINAVGAFAGLGKFGVEGCATFNVEVEGGKYAVYATPDREEKVSPYNGEGIMMGCTFKNQEEAVFLLSDTPLPIILAGFHIVRDKGVLNIGNVYGERGGISLVDGIIEMNGGQIFNDNNNFYMRNVYVKGADSVANGWTIDDKNNWTHIKEYVYTNSNGRTLIDGNISPNYASSEYRAKVENVDVTQSQLINGLVKKHQWDEATFPSFEDSDAIDVKEMGANSAKGDGVTDDTDALKYAIEHYDKIFLPKGIYRISDTLELKSNTQLFGMGSAFSQIRPHSSWSPSGETIILTTVDDKNAKTILAFLSVNTHEYLEIPGGQDGFTPIQWRAGRNSMTRNVIAGIFAEYWQPISSNFNYHRLRINNSGGGRHFSPICIWVAGGGGYFTKRGLLIEGTEEPLYIYAVNGGNSDINIDIKNARNVYVYGFYHEGCEVSVNIDRSENICVVSSYKNTEIGTGRAGIEVFESDNVLVADYVPNLTNANSSILKEIYGGVTNVIHNNGKVSFVGLFKRGELEEIPPPSAHEFISTSILLGDASGDDEVSAYDAALTAHLAVGLSHPDIKNPEAAEVSGDAEVSAYDAALIAQKAVGLIDKFPVEG